jgi:hypothetical protein
MNVCFIKIFTVNSILKTPLIGFYSDAVYLNLATFTIFFRKELIYITLEPRKAYPWVFEREFTVIYFF